MATFTKFYGFVETLAHGGHDLSSDQLAVALTNTAPGQDDVALADLTEIAYTNLSSRNVTTSGSVHAMGVYKLTLADLTLTASGAVDPFRYVVLYNTNAPVDQELIAWLDHGESVTMGAGDEFDIDFDGINGALTLT